MPPSIDHTRQSASLRLYTPAEVELPSSRVESAIVGGPVGEAGTLLCDGMPIPCEVEDSEGLDALKLTTVQAFRVYGWG